MNQGNFAKVNGLEMYYEVHGTGTRLILLHGGVGSGEMFGEVIPLLAKCCQVITVDLQSHGRTADIERPMRFETLADDVAGLIDQLGPGKVDIMGYSFGGSVALRTAIQHPDKVRKLVVVSAPFKRSGWYPEVVEGMGQMGPGAAETMKQTPMYANYASIAPRPEDWPKLLTRLGDLLRQDYDWSKEVQAIKLPTLLVIGDADSVRTSHAVEFFELLGGGKKDANWDGSGVSNSRLAILPGATHYNIFSMPTLAFSVAPFLEAPMPEGSPMDMGERSLSRAS